MFNGNFRKWWCRHTCSFPNWVSPSPLANMNMCMCHDIEADYLWNGAKTLVFHFKPVFKSTCEWGFSCFRLVFILTCEILLHKLVYKQLAVKTWCISNTGCNSLWSWGKSKPRSENLQLLDFWAMANSLSPVNYCGDKCLIFVRLYISLQIEMHRTCVHI